MRPSAVSPGRWQVGLLVADRPATVCAWDASGGRLGSGDLGCWERGEQRRTRLVVTGYGEADRQHPERVPVERLATPAELQRASVGDDGLAAWPGPPGDVDAADA